MTVAAYPMPAIGGPQYRRFAELEKEYAVTTTGPYQDKGQDFNVDAPGAVRTFQIDYDILTELEAKTLDDHFDSAFGTGFPFALTTPTIATPSAESLANVHYKTYSRPPHDIRGLQARNIVLVKYPT
jgi:hypothetical protein